MWARLLTEPQTMLKSACSRLIRFRTWRTSSWKSASTFPIPQRLPRVTFLSNCHPAHAADIRIWGIYGLAHFARESIYSSIYSPLTLEFPHKSTQFQTPKLPFPGTVDRISRFLHDGIEFWPAFWASECENADFGCSYVLTEEDLSLEAIHSEITFSNGVKTQLVSAPKPSFMQKVPALMITVQN